MCENKEVFSKSEMLDNALAKGFDILASDEGTEAKQMFVKQLLGNEHYREILLALTGVAMGELGAALKANGLEEDPADWDTKTKEEKMEFVRQLAPKVATPENMEHALDLVWLGMNIGLSIDIHDSKEKQAERMIREVMDATRYGKGNCTFCFKRAYLMKWGPSGEPICANCAEKHPEGILSTINKMLQEKFGDDAPIAIAGGVSKAGDVNSKIQEAIRNARETDISKFN